MITDQEEEPRGDAGEGPLATWQEEHSRMLEMLLALEERLHRQARELTCHLDLILDPERSRIDLEGLRGTELGEQFSEWIRRTSSTTVLLEGRRRELDSCLRRTHEAVLFRLNRLHSKPPCKPSR